MRILKVEFQRLLGFKHVAVEIDPSLQLIAGPNNAGKSTMVRLIETFFSNPVAEDFQELKPLNEYYLNEGARALSLVTIHFGHLSPEEAQVFERIIRKPKGTFSLSLRFTRRGSISLEASRHPGADEARRYYEEVLSRFHFVKIPSMRIADGEFGEAEPLERLLETLEAVLVRKGRARSTSLQQAFAEKLAPVESLVRDVLNESANAIKEDLPFQENEVRFRLPDSRHALRGMLSAAVIESQGHVSVPVALRGTGFQSALVLGILRYVARREVQAGGNVFLAIEEPEAFLHPQTQRAMAKIVRGIADDAQVLVTTHSSVLVDSFSVDQIARLPLQPNGLDHSWARPPLEPTDIGRLTRWCSAANSELVFANAVILVEGEGDFGVVEKLLGRICGDPGGHYALGVTVIEAGGVGKFKYLLQLARLFGVKAYILADRDSLHKKDGHRALEDVLRMHPHPPGKETFAELRTESDRPSSSLDEALARQRILNDLLAPFDSFVLAADLEGLLLDMYGEDDLIRLLGPGEYGVIAAPHAESLLQDRDGRTRLASWMGSKGWNSDGAKTGKLPPHLPAVLIGRWLDDERDAGEVLGPLFDWLAKIVSDAAPAPL